MSRKGEQPDSEQLTAEEQSQLARDLAAMQEKLPEPGRKQDPRRDFILEADLDPGSLCGSWFLRFEAEDVVWQGLVIGEPQPGKYLCEVALANEPRFQRVVPIEDMAGDPVDDGFEWRFYDTLEDLRAAFTHHETRRG